MGYSLLHSSTVGLVRNLQMNNISPQYHLVFDDWFETIHTTEQAEPKVWPDLFECSRFSNQFDKNEYGLALSREWLSKDKLKDLDVKRPEVTTEGNGQRQVDPPMPISPPEEE